MKVSIYWFRRDLRLEDNRALFYALQAKHPVLPLFIFDTNITGELQANDARISFIYDQLKSIHKQLSGHHSGLLLLMGKPEEIFKKLIAKFEVAEVFYNKDYEPYARERDKAIGQLLKNNGIAVNASKDQVIFEENEVIKGDGSPYTVFTPYKNKWLEKYHHSGHSERLQYNPNNFFQHTIDFPSIEDFGFKASDIKVLPPALSKIHDYATTRDIPAIDGTSHLGPHLRFGTISIRRLVKEYLSVSEVFVSELIWREFFMQIIHHFPHVVDRNFRQKYDGIQWRNNEKDFSRWCAGNTGYPIVDAGMRQLNQTGYMHNRVRMITASFLCKHLLIDWRWGEAYFAGKLLDYELSSNNGNWQWAAGTGCDAAPYFRVFNPAEQQRKFDNDQAYIRQWITELTTADYPKPIVEHKLARERALKTYKAGLA